MTNENTIAKAQSFITLMFVSGKRRADMTNMEVAVQQSLRAIENNANQLVQHSKWLAEKLEKATKDLSSDPSAHINSLGLVQGVGSEIDRLCGERTVLIANLEVFLTFIKTESL
jgi:hypothetical protein